MSRAGPAAAAMFSLVLVAACESPMAPTACGPIPQVTVHVGETSSVPACFNDADGDVLSYGVGSSNPSVAVAALAGGAVTVTGRGPGSATITVTAVDSDALQAQQSFRVAVPNRPPLARGSIPAQRVEAGREVVVDLAPWFDDPDEDPLAYVASSSDPSAVEATASVTARDPDGLTAVHSFGAEAPNRAPRPVGSIPAQAIQSGETATVDVSAYFADPDGDALTYAASSSDPSVAAVSVSGTVVRIAALTRGSATVEVTAADPGGLSAALSFQVTVTGDESPPGSFQIELRFATAMTASQRAAFESARARWMAILADTELPDMPVPEGLG